MPSAKLPVLVVDDEPEVGTFFRHLLDGRGFEVTAAGSGLEAREALKSARFDVALVDLKLPDTDGLELLRLIKARQPACEVVIMTGYGTTKTAVRAMQLGAFDYIEKPFSDLGEIEDVVRRAAGAGRGEKGTGQAAEEWLPLAVRLGFLVGKSAEMKKLVSLAYKIARKDINVLIQGETGTGKEVLARFIHAASPRAAQPFIPVNCGALPENILESELFGHEKGAFTGAGSVRRGIFELANKGTLFLDEVGEASLSIQVKLLRVLETGEFLRVGGERPIRTDVRVIAATNVDLEQAVKEKTFREDLFYRLDVVCLQVPPLRARREDIPLFVDHFLSKVNPQMRISPEALEILCAYPWPGNVRELANTISRAAVLCEGGTVTPDCLSRKIAEGAAYSRAELGPGKDAGEGLARRILEAVRRDYFGESALDGLDNEELFALAGLLEDMRAEVAGVLAKRPGAKIPPPALKEVEERAVREALSYSGGNVALAARTLGVGRNTLYRKIKEYGLEHLARGR